MSGERVDLVVRLEYGPGGTFVARATWGGTAYSEALTVDAEVALAGLRSGTSVSRQIGDDEDAAPDSVGRASEVGAALFGALFHGSMRAPYELSRAAARGARARWRLVLDITAPEMGRVPWELLRDPTPAGPEFLACDGLLARRPALGGRVVAPPRRGKLKILWVGASPEGLPPLALERERAVLERALRRVPEESRPACIELAPATRRGLLKALQTGEIGEAWGRQTFEVLHFAGHGFVENGEPRLALEGDGALDEGAEGRGPSRGPSFVSAQELAAAVRQQPALRLVVLNACHGSTGDSRDALSSLSARLSANGVPAVVGMQSAIVDSLAVLLTGHFYGALGRGERIDEALRQARSMACVERPDWVENGPWAAPVLWLSGEGAEELGMVEAEAPEVVPGVPQAPGGTVAQAAQRPAFEPLPRAPSGPVDVLYVSAPEDEALRKELATHLRPTLRQLELADGDVGAVAGTADEALDEAVARARLVLLLVTPSYLADERCRRAEGAALQRRSLGAAHAGGALSQPWIVPVYVTEIADWNKSDAGNWSSEPFGKLTRAPQGKGGDPVTKWRDRGEAWVDVARAVRALLKKLAPPLGA